MRKRAVLSFLAILTVAFGLPLIVATPAQAHGWITTPPSRQDHCAKGRTSFDCGPIKYEPQSVEAAKGSKLCSGGSQFRILDDSSKPWPVTSVGSTVTFQWKLTAAHNTSTWDYYVDGKLFKQFDQRGQQPPSNISHTLSGLPGGRHLILAVWNVSNTANAFYNCMDVQIGGGGGAPPPPPPPPPPPGGSCGGLPAYSPTAVYTGGQRVQHKGHAWKAKWWTKGEEPGSTGVWGVWADEGACSAAQATTGHDMSGHDMHAHHHMAEPATTGPSVTRPVLA